MFYLWTNLEYASVSDVDLLASDVETVVLAIFVAVSVCLLKIWLGMLICKFLLLLTVH